jgi:hypothetical protein
VKDATPLDSLRLSLQERQDEKKSNRSAQSGHTGRSGGVWKQYSRGRGMWFGNGVCTSPENSIFNSHIELCPKVDIT